MHYTYGIQHGIQNSDNKHKALIITTLSIIALITMTLSIVTLGIIMTFGIKTFYHCNTKH
jgi:hypothetical protein